MEAGDFIRGKPENKEYSITYSKMMRGVIIKVYNDNLIRVKILEHEDRDFIGKAFDVESRYFEVIGHVKPFSRDELLELLKNGYKKAILDYNLSYADLSYADLSGADLSNADLSGAKLSYADLSNADLSGAKLSYADLSYADLSNADLSNADLSGAKLSNADLSYADLSGAKLSNADLSNAKLSNNADLSNADLSGAKLSGADLSGADLSNADLSGAKLDFSCLPLKCGGLKWRIDKRIACQLAYHLCSMQCEDKEFIRLRNILLPFANQFHKAKECGELLPIVQENKL
jgi:hypothetical protein